MEAKAMRAGILRLGVAMFLAGAAAVAIALCQGQEGTSSASPPVPSVGGAGAQLPAANPTKDKLNLNKLPVFQRQIYLAAQRGAEWLQRANRVDGRFQHGLVPALRRPLDGDHYLRQAGAALALARTARFLHDDKAAALARQAVLTLLLDTEKDPQNVQVRRTTFPPGVVSRLGAAGLMVTAIYELPSPGADLLSQAEELCGYIHKQQRKDGALVDTEPASEGKISGAAAEGEAPYAALALVGLMRAHQARPDARKLDLARKARDYYQASWRARKQLAPVPALTAAFAEAYLATREQAFADFVLEMNDWLCTLQYEQLDPRHVYWLGGFMGWVDGRAVQVPPGIDSAQCAESLAEACRVARALGDVHRHPRYLQALERSLQFLLTLQYTEANAQHFTEWYRPEVLGGFFVSHQDATLRIDYNQHAVCAMVRYLGQVVDLP
jgi:hypothetical protein